MREHRIGLISDTHGLLRPEAVKALEGSDLILHAGDVGSADILTELARLAPLIAVRGNNDHGAWAGRLPGRTAIELHGWRILVVHDLHSLPESAWRRADIVVSGHSHRPASRFVEGVKFVNPGSAGPRRFKLPVTVATLTLGRRVAVRFVHLRIEPPKAAASARTRPGPRRAPAPRRAPSRPRRRRREP